MEARRESCGSHRAGITGGCVSPNVDTGNQTQALWKSTKYIPIAFSKHISKLSIKPSGYNYNTMYLVILVNKECYLFRKVKTHIHTAQVSVRIFS